MSEFIINLDELFDGREFVTPNELADAMAVNPKSLRAWMRRHAESTPGRGNRWNIDRSVAEFIASEDGFYSTPNRKVTVMKLK